MFESWQQNKERDWVSRAIQGIGGGGIIALLVVMTTVLPRLDQAKHGFL